MGNPPVRVDILQSVDGLEFDPVLARHLRVEWHGVEVCLISREDLIISKRAAGRPQDLVDAANLENPGGVDF